MNAQGWLATLLLLMAVAPYAHQSWWTWGLMAAGVVVAIIPPLHELLSDCRHDEETQWASRWSKRQ